MAKDPFSAWMLAKDDSVDAEIVKIFDVLYIHLKLDDDEDLYVSRYGLPYVEQLKPANYLLDREWFDTHSIRLSDDSCTYRVTTKKVNDKTKDIIIKWNRMGEDVPGEGKAEAMGQAEFNSPFEEFSLVMELRKTKYESQGRIITQKPLAIYVPNELREECRTPRDERKMQSLIRAHKDVKLDVLRQYLVIYEWVKGIDAAQAHLQGLLTEKQVGGLVKRVEAEMTAKGYFVRDGKADNIIIKPVKGGNLLCDIEGNIMYALVDFELLGRTAERRDYLDRIRNIHSLKSKRDKYKFNSGGDMPARLKNVKIMGVNYICGPAESTGGALWVAGEDPYLFDYFLPERWQKTPRTRLSGFDDIFQTVTRDKIQLVWKISRVGLVPDVDPSKKKEKKILDFGYNSPFEEMSIASEIKGKGFRTVLPKAVYMTGSSIRVCEEFLDNSRYESHKYMYTDEGVHVLRRERLYYILWAYAVSTGEKSAVWGSDNYSGVNALNAYRRGLVEFGEYVSLLNKVKSGLAACGMEDLNIRGAHFLLALDAKGSFILEKDGLPEPRIVNFELLKRKKSGF
ncbi:MAG: hypothetical protein JW969_07065 [Spirochaetales bacterium]|nr:hypothetical protein [Spirochaetales bacterium]